MALACIQRRTVIIVFAFGTRGDVQPVALLAESLSSVYDDVFFVSHGQLEKTLKELWGSTACIKFIASPSPPHAADAGFGPEVDIAAILRPRKHLQVCIDAVKQALVGSSLSPKHPPSVLLICNLFALEAVHLAEAWSLPLIIVHPYTAPSTLSRNFNVLFRRTDPLQYNILKKESWSTEDSERSTSHTQIKWVDIEHYLWPIFLDSWKPFRRMLFGVENDKIDGINLPWLAGRPSIPLLYLYSESILPRPHHFPHAVHVVGFIFEEKNAGSFKPPPILTAFLSGATGRAVEKRESPCVPSQETTGRLVPDITKKVENASSQVGQKEFCPEVGPVYVSFGTMVSLGALGDLDRAARALIQALLSPSLSSEVPSTSIPIRCVVDAAHSPRWVKALQLAVATCQVRERVLILEESVPHSWLLPQCSAIVHHGGSGTTAAALRAGIAQVVVPGMMDQFLWAERVASLGLGPSPPGIAEVFPEGPAENTGGATPCQVLSVAIAQAMHPFVRLRAAAMGRRLRAEPSGLQRCATLIAHYLEEWQRLPLPPPVRPPLPFSLPLGCELVDLEVLDDMGSSAHCDVGGQCDASRATFSALTVAVLEGSESEVAFIHQEIFPPGVQTHGWGYLRHGVHVKADDIVLDVGANIGLFALYLDLHVMDQPERVSILAVEPAPRTFQALQYNLAAYGVKQIACLQQAVGAEVNRVEGMGDAADEEAKPEGGHHLLRFYPHAPGNSTLLTQKLSHLQGKSAFKGVNAKLRAHLTEGAEDFPVRVTTVSALVRDYALPRVNLLKIDVEGHEEAVLHGIDGKTWDVIEQVAMEVHDVDGRLARIECLLRRQGFGSVVSETPVWAQGGCDGEALDNRMVYAHRNRHPS